MAALQSFISRFFTFNWSPFHSFFTPLNKNPWVTTTKCGLNSYIQICSDIESQLDVGRYLLASNHHPYTERKFDIIKLFHHPPSSVRPCESGTSTFDYFLVPVRSFQSHLIDPSYIPRPGQSDKQRREAWPSTHRPPERRRAAVHQSCSAADSCALLSRSNHNDPRREETH